MNSVDNHGRRDLNVKVEIGSDSRLIMYITNSDGITREATIEINGDNSDQILFMNHGPYDINDTEGTYNDEPTFVAKVGTDRGYVYNNYTGTGGRLGTEFAMVSDAGIELTNTMEFPEPTAGFKP